MKPAEDAAREWWLGVQTRTTLYSPDAVARDLAIFLATREAEARHEGASDALEKAAQAMCEYCSREDCEPAQHVANSVYFHSKIVGKGGGFRECKASPIRALAEKEKA